MTKVQAAKRSWSLSVVALLLCISMLIGTTYAWFTDNVTSAGNIITSGNLDLEMYWTDDPATGTWHDVEDPAYNKIFDYDKWEPGYTEVRYIKLVNAGNLALNYQLTLTPEGSVGKLAEVINVYAAEGEVELKDRSDLSKLGAMGLLTSVLDGGAAAEGTLLAEGQESLWHDTKETVLTIAMSMITTAGNEYQDESVGDGFSIKALATQCPYEKDSFGSDYDSNAEYPVSLVGKTASAAVKVQDGKVAEAVTISGNGISAIVPAGVAVKDGTEKLIVKITPLKSTTTDITVVNNEILIPVDVHIEGVAEGNTVPIIVDLGEILPKYLNMGNYALIHVEDGVNNTMTFVNDKADLNAHNRFTYEPLTGAVTVSMASFSEVALMADTTAKWEGKEDYSWYTDEAKTSKSFAIANADQLHAFAKIVGGMADDIELDDFSGDTVKLLSDINLNHGTVLDNADGTTKTIFYPIGYSNNQSFTSGNEVNRPTDPKTDVTSGVQVFKGTFDGNGHTIANFYQNTWEMFGDYNSGYPANSNYYKDAMGLFAWVDGTVKNLTVDNFESDGEFTPTGVIAAYAGFNGDATFENIAITNCNPRVYNTGNGGIVGIGGNEGKENNIVFKNITIDSTNKITALWGSWDVACGGLMGMFRGKDSQNPVVTMSNCHVAAQIDVYNDVCGNYQYYWYRYSGMLIGTNYNMTTENGYTVPNTKQYEAENCTVHFGDWNDYYYCELVANSLASYTHDHQFSRLEQISSIDEIKSGDTWTKTGNFLLISGDTKTCYHIVKNSDGALKQHLHTDAGEETVNGETVLKEDKQIVYLPFNQLFTGYGWGVKHIPIYDDGTPNPFTGVTILDRVIADSKKKFEKADSAEDSYTTESTVTIGELFKAAEIDDEKLSIKPDKVQVTVSPMNNSGVSGTYVANTNDWTQGTLTFSGIGAATITITDYYFCMPTTISVTIKDKASVEKFEKKFTGDFLYRVGNQNAVKLESLFKAKEGVKIGTVSVTVETVDGTASGTYTSNATWTNGTIQFSDTGVVKVTITDNDYCTPTVLYLEVVDAVNATTVTNATKNNVVLLNDCGFSSLEVSGGYALYGNGFTMTCSSDSVAADLGYSFVTLNDGTLDNVQIVCPNFDYAALYKSNLTSSDNRNETDANEKKRYYNARSGVTTTGNSQILNSRISGGRAALNVSGGNVVVDNSRIELGAVATVLVGAANSLTLRDATLIQKPAASTYDSNKTLMGFSVLYLCDSEGKATPTTLEGSFVQQAWVNEDDKQYVPSAGQDIVGGVMEETDFIHNINGKDSLNLGFAYMPEDAQETVAEPDNITDNRTDKATIPYEMKAVDIQISLLSTTVYVYSYKNTNGTADSFKTESEYVPNKYSDIITVSYSDTADGITTGKSYGTDGWVYELNVDLDKLSGYALDFSKLSMNVNGVTITDFKVNYNAKPTTPVAVTAGGTTYTLTATINDVGYTATFKVTGTETSKESPSLVASNYEAALLVGEAGSTFSKDTWHGAAPALQGIQIKYWSVAENQYKTISLSDYTPTTAGKQNGTNTTWTYSPDNGDFTLTLTGGQVHSSNNVNAMPVVCNSKLYFVAAGSNGLVNYGNSARTIPVTYSFKDNNGGTELTFSHTWSIECANGNTAYDYSDFCNGTSKTFTIKSSNGSGCLTPDTLITLADGSKKEIQHVRVGDQVLAWNFHTGAYEVVPVTLLQAHSTGVQNVLHLYFEDGTELKILGEHGVFDADLNNFVFIDEHDVENYIGDRFVKQNGDGFKTVKLVDYKVTTEFTTAYTILSLDHYNVMAEDMFTVTPAHVGENFFNPFDIGEDMKYDEEAVKADIEKYGLYTYEDFDHVLTYEQFVALNLGHFKVSVGKGYVTYDGLIYLIENFVNNEDFNV